MKKWLGMIGILLLGGGVSAAWVDAEKAANVAFAFAKQNVIIASHTEGVGEAATWGNVWVVPLKPSGYVVVEKDDIRPPVIAFDTKNFPTTPPPALAKLLERPSVEDNGVAAFSTLSETSAHEEWDLLLTSSSDEALGVETKAFPTVPEKVKLYRIIPDFYYEWSQTLPYNLYAPGVSRARVPFTESSPRDNLAVGTFGSYGLRSTCGCVATAFSQVGAWFQWPYALRGVSVCAHTENEDEGEEFKDINFVSYQVATPGKPYDWGALEEATTPTAENEDEGEEVGRFVQHWATLTDMGYYKDTSSGTYSTLVRPDLLLLAGYKLVTPEGVVGTLTRELDEETGKYGWVVSDLETYDEGQVEALYGAFYDAIYKYNVPTATGVSGHYIVCDGWGQQVDSVLSPENCYARVNYGWGPNTTYSGWYALRKDIANSDGEYPTTDTTFLQTCFTILPLQCGEIVNLSKRGTIPKTDKTNKQYLEWYEAPYWSDQYPNATRHLKVQTFANAISDTDEPIALNLKAAAKSDGNWIYTPTTENPSETTGRLEMDQTCAGITTAVLFPELLKASNAWSIEVALERMTYQAKSAPEDTTESVEGEIALLSEGNEDSTTSTEDPIVPEDQARKLLLAIEDVETGALICKRELTLGDHLTQVSGTCKLDFTTDVVPSGTVFRVLLCTGSSPLNSDEGLQIPADTLAYAVTGIAVKGTYPSTQATYAFTNVRKTSTRAGALTRGTLPDVLAEATEGATLWLAVTIDTNPSTETDADSETGTETATEKTYDALWKSLTIPTNEKPAVVLPTIAFEESRLFLNKLDTPIRFTMTGDIRSVKAYLSQGSWLKEGYRDGFLLTDTERTSIVETKDVDEDGIADDIFAFTLEGRAYTGESTSDAELTIQNADDTTQNDATSEDVNVSPDTANLDAMTLNSLETVGRDAVLSLCATDHAGNVVWTHVRLTWGYSDEIVALIQKQNARTLHLDRLLFAALYAGCYIVDLDKEYKQSTLFPTSETITVGEKTQAQFDTAMDLIADLMRLGYATEGNELSTKLLYGMLQKGAGFVDPRVEVLSVTPNAITFQMSAGISTPNYVVSPQTLSQYVGTSSIIIESGETLDAMGPLDWTEIQGMTLTDNGDGTYTLKLLANDKNRFFRIKL